VSETLADKAAPPGSPTWYALLFTPAERRRAAAALFELQAEVMTSTRRVQEPEVAHARLAWWRAELGGYGSGREQHPLTRALRETGYLEAIQPEYLVEMVDAAQSELSDSPCRNYQELALYCYRSSGVLQEMIAGLAGLEEPGNERAVRRFAQRLGTGVRMVQLIEELPRDLAAGRRLLPRDWIQETGACEALDERGAVDAALAACLDRIAGEARLALDEAESAVPAPERSRQVTGLVLAALYRRRLARLHAASFDSRAVPGNLNNLWTAWQAARRSLKSAGR
jgi:15-cis-phytoene synthase